MGLAQFGMLGAAVATLLALPCAVIALRTLDEAALRRRRGWGRPAEETQALRELDRALRESDDLPGRGGRSARGGRSVRGDRQARGDRPAGGDRSGRGDESARGDRFARRDRRAHDDRPALGDRPAVGDQPQWGDRPLLDDAPAQTIDDIARELRRLDRQRRGGPTLESERWLAAVLRAYDDGLCRACRCVGVSEHLEPLEGMDREIERVRVEGALQAAGVALR